MKKKIGKIVGKFKGKCLNCKKSMIVVERESSSKWLKGLNIRIANFYCSKKCEKQFKNILDKAIAFSEGYEKAEKYCLKQIRKIIKKLKSRIIEADFNNKRYYQDFIDLLEGLIKNWKEKDKNKQPR